LILKQLEAEIVKNDNEFKSLTKGTKIITKFIERVTIISNFSIIC